MSDYISFKIQNIATQKQHICMLQKNVTIDDLRCMQRELFHSEYDELDFNMTVNVDAEDESKICESITQYTESRRE